MEGSIPLIALYILLSLAAIITLVILYVNCKKNKENLCLCNGAGTTEVCRDRDWSQKMYRDGWTEYTDLAAVQNKLGGAAWDRTACGNCR